jgi:hypothetical protein
MLSMVHPFYAMASDCAAPLRRNGCKDGATCCRRPERSEENRAALFALPGDSELTRINKVAAAGAVSTSIRRPLGLSLMQKPALRRAMVRSTLPRDCCARCGAFQPRECPIKHRLMLYCPSSDLRLWRRASTCTADRRKSGRRGDCRNVHVSVLSFRRPK